MTIHTTFGSPGAMLGLIVLLDGNFVISGSLHRCFDALSRLIFEVDHHIITDADDVVSLKVDALYKAPAHVAYSP